MRVNTKVGNAIAPSDETCEGDLRERMEASALRFGQPRARLFPLIDTRVWTPQGAGKLLSVFMDRCEVHPDGAERTVCVRPDEVLPIQ